MHGDPINTLRTKVPVHIKGKVKATTEEHMNSLADKPKRVKAYFHRRLVSAVLRTFDKLG